MSVLELNGRIRLARKSGERLLEYSMFLGRPSYRNGFKRFGSWQRGTLWAGWLIASWRMATSPLPIPANVKPNTAGRWWDRIRGRDTR